MVGNGLMVCVFIISFAVNYVFVAYKFTVVSVVGLLFVFVNLVIVPYIRVQNAVPFVKTVVAQCVNYVALMFGSVPFGVKFFVKNVTFVVIVEGVTGSAERKYVFGFRTAVYKIDISNCVFGYFDSYADGCITVFRKRSAFADKAVVEYVFKRIVFCVFVILGIFSGNVAVCLFVVNIIILISE